MARDKNKRSLIPVSHYLFDFWKEELHEELQKWRQEASITPRAPELTLSLVLASQREKSEC